VISGKHNTRVRHCLPTQAQLEQLAAAWLAWNGGEATGIDQLLPFALAAGIVDPAFCADEHGQIISLGRRIGPLMGMAVLGRVLRIHRCRKGMRYVLN